jgi:uncharacterized protein YpmS
MISNDKSMNYKVVALNESYNFHITLTAFAVHMNKYIYIFKNIFSREENFVLIVRSLK